MKRPGALIPGILIFASVAVDAGAWAFGLSAAVFTRYEFAITPARLTTTALTNTALTNTALTVVLVIGLHTLIGHAHLLYRAGTGSAVSRRYEALP